MKYPYHLFHRFSSSSSSTAYTFLTTIVSTPIAKQATLLYLIKRGVTPSISDLNLFLSFLFRSERHNLCLSFFSQITSNSIKPNNKSNAIVVHSLLKSCSGSKSSEKLISYAGKFGVKAGNGILNALIYKVCVLEKDPNWAFNLLQDFMRNFGLIPSNNTLCTLISAFCSRGEMESAVKVFDVMSSSKEKCQNWNYACSMIISGFSKIGKLELGIGFYERIKKLDGFSPNLVTCTAFVDTLCKDGRIEEASDLISEMEEKGITLDPVIYSSLISGFFRKGFLTDGLMKHCAMIKKGVFPDVVNYTNIIEGLCKEGSVEKVLGFLNEMMRRNINPNLVTLTSLIGGFCKRGRYKEALQVFKKIEEFGIVSDNFAETILVDSMCKNVELEMAFDFVKEIENKGIKPGIVTYNALINGLCKAGRTNDASEIARGVVADNFTYATLLHGFLKERNEKGIIEINKRLERSNMRMDIVTCNMLIKALFTIGKVGDACNLFDEMPERKLVANSVTYSTMIEGLIKAGKLDMAVHIFFDLINEYLVPDSSTCLKLFCAQFEEYGADGILNLVREIENIENSAGLSLISDYAIGFLSRNNFPNEALKMYLFLHKRGVRITCETSNVLINSLIQNGKEAGINDAYNILQKANKNGVSIDISSFSLLIDRLCKAGSIEKALDLCEIMRKRGVFPNIDLYNSILNGLCNQGSFFEAFRVLDALERSNVRLTVFTYTPVIGALCKEGLLKDAHKLFDKMIHRGITPDTRVSNLIISGYCNLCLVEDAKKFLSNMDEKYLIRPDKFTISAFIKGFCLKGDIEGAFGLFNEYKRKGILPTFFGFMNLVNGFYIRGRLEEARGVLREMLNCAEIMVMVNKYGGEIFYGEPLVTILSDACEKGKIREVVAILSEVGYMNNSNLRNSGEIVELNHENLLGKSFYDDFDSYYPTIAALCLKGEVKEANNVINAMIMNSG